jgi:hypothetical protein
MSLSNRKIIRRNARWLFRRTALVSGSKMLRLLVGYVISIIVLGLLSELSHADPIHLISNPDSSINGRSMTELVELHLGENPKNSRCGYKLTRKVWQLSLSRAKENHEVARCQVPSNYYILLELTSSRHIEMNSEKYDCDSLNKGANHDVDSLHDPDLWLDNLYISSLEPFKETVGGCPDPVLSAGNTFSGHRSYASGHFVFIKPIAPSKHRIVFSITNPCWTDLRNLVTGECPAKESRRTVELFLTVNPFRKKTPKSRRQSQTKQSNQVPLSISH